MTNNKKSSPRMTNLLMLESLALHFLAMIDTQGRSEGEPIEGMNEAHLAVQKFMENVDKEITQESMKN